MWRYLAPNKSCEGPRHIFSVDTETTRIADAHDESASREVLRLGVARYFRFDGRRQTNSVEFAFRTPDQFWAWLSRRAAARCVNWVFAHSAGFDLRVLGWGAEIDSERLSLSRPQRRPTTAEQGSSPRQPRSGLLVLDGPPTIVDCWFQGGAQIRICDTRNWWNIPLADMGRSLGLDKLPLPDPWDTDESWLTYCRRDCEIVDAAVYQLLCWHREHDLGVFRPTAAGQAMQCYRHRFNRVKIVLHDEEPVKRLERAGYYAGRLAQFYHGIIDRGGVGWTANDAEGFDPRAPRPCGVVHKLDCNSLFPSVMRSRFYPRRLLDWSIGSAESTPPADLPLERTIARVTVSCCRLPLPVRTRGRVDFAVGDYTTTLVGPELVAAVESSESVVIHDWAIYELADLFSEYVDYFWDLRQQCKSSGDSMSAGLAKLMLNSLYGKFGQHAYEWLSLPGQVPPDPWHCWCEIERGARQVAEYRSIGDLVQLRQPAGDHATSFTAVSAFVTANARRRMDEYRRVAGWHNCYYQGVDSMFVSDRGLERLRSQDCVSDTELGKLRLEGSSDYTIFRGLGYYLFSGQWTRASIRRGAREIAIGSWRQDQFESLERSCSKPQVGGVSVKSIIRTIDPERGGVETTPAGWVKPTIGQPCGLSPADLATCYV